jgi:hypothetical protein
MMSNDRRLLAAAGKGLAAGAVGVAVMTLGEKVERAFTHRPNSLVPAHMLGLPFKPDGKRPGFNLAMHWGQGIALGALRGLMAEGRLRGPWASAMFTVVRLTADQTQENITEVEAPPWTWPRGELLTDLLHKGIYGFVTGVVADRLARAAAGVGPSPPRPLRPPPLSGRGWLRAHRVQQRPVSAPGGQVSWGLLVQQEAVGVQPGSSWGPVW